MEMHALIIYDSQFGNTERVAKAMASAVGGVAIRVQDFRWEMFAGISLCVVGSPIQGWRPTKAITSMLAAIPAGSLHGMHVAAFDTRFNSFLSGNAAKKINKLLCRRGGESIAPPEPFYVLGKEGPLQEGELDRAVAWAKKVATPEK